MLLTTNLMVLTADEGLSRLFGLDFQLLADAVLTLIAIFVLCFVFSFFLFKPVRKILEDRSEKIKNELPKASLRLVGDGNLIEQTKKLVSDLDLDESVIFDGIRKDMEQVYADSDVIILTSQYEGMPNALIEAIGCGIPVVSYDCPIGPSEIIEDGVNGFLIDQNDIDEFAKKTIIALKQSWDEDIIKATCKKFDAQVIAKQYEEIFASL